MPPSSAHDELPIEGVLGELRDTLRRNTAAVLQAPPGAGKTTRVPLALLGEPWLGGRRILMLEPRRLATRAAARRMAATLGEPVGATVGFRVRGEARVSAASRIEVVTEGILTRMVLDDPTLEDVGIVIFDEFHERSLHADLGLALALQSQKILRPELRVLVMSATLDGAGISLLLGNAPIITSTTHSFPVEVRYQPPRAGERVEECVARCIRGIAERKEGNVLAFLPGTGEIHRCMRLLHGSLSRDVELLPLFGDLSATEQDRAIARPSAGMTKVVLSTSIAETSLTIDGVNVVVDGGFSRLSRFSARSGMSRLVTVRTSRSSAEQRTGRAGRTAPGISYRLWAAEESAQLPDRNRPEILEADLASFALDLAAFGVADASELDWIDPPPAASIGHAQELLRQLGALDALNLLTAHGRALARMGTHPRLAHALVIGRELGVGATACAVSALLEERDVLQRSAVGRDIDIRTRVALLADDAGRAGEGVDHDALRRVRAQYRSWRSALRLPLEDRVDEHDAGRVLALAYPERVALRRAGRGHRYLLRSGSGAVLDDPGALASAPFLVVADLDGKSPDARVHLAAPIDRAEIEQLFSGDITRMASISWDARVGAISAVESEVLGAMVLAERPLRDADAERVADIVLEAIAGADGVELHWSRAALELQGRVEFARTLDPSWPDLSAATLSASLATWLRPRLLGVRRRSDVERLPLEGILLDMLSWRQRASLEVVAPTHAMVPTGSRIPIDYSDPAAPFIAVRLQELFGLADTPCVGEGKVPLTLHLLSPAHRPVQVTRDLAGFWKSSYFDVRKDLRGRYPKHEWPEDPMSATPTRRAKPRKQPG